VFRTLRILRPLRAINKIERMKDIINTLLSSIPGLMNVMFFLFFVASVFGILGVHQFQGAQYNRCRSTELPTDGYWAIDENVEGLCNSDEVCTLKSGGTSTWCRAPLFAGLLPTIDDPNNDEDVFYNIVGFEVYMKSMATIFQAITLEGWSLMMYNFADGDSPVMSVIFFGSLVIFGAFFALNLLLA
jgi:voltage-dependent calcium channel L type alpha-1D